MSRRLLSSLRTSRGHSQAAVAKTMRVSQSAVSKLESREDISLAALRDSVRALGGALEIAARFGKERVAIPAREVTYGARASARRVREREPAPMLVTSSDVSPERVPILREVPPEWLAEVDRIRAMSPAARMEEIANMTAFYAAAKRRA
jgi:transcriptional regulator with XRE-family HTH domain